MLRWIRSPRPSKPHRSPRYRPSLELLEDRRLLAFTVFQQTNLVADEPGVALIHDPSLVEAWGVSLSSAGGAFWVSARGTGVSTLYLGDVNGSPFTKAGLTVTIPGGSPTGQVFNGTGQFTVTSGADSGTALFIFASDTGHITGWNPAVPPPPPSQLAQLAVTNPGGAVWTGITIGSNADGNFLYATDFRDGSIDVFDSSFAPATLDGSFVDPDLPAGFAPFNIQQLGGKLYVTYARQDDPDAGPFPKKNGGLVNVFDTDGHFLQRLVTNQGLSAPYGLALAPADFGPFGNALLVGSFGDGRIRAFDPDTGEFLGRLRARQGGPIRIDGLLGLAFGNGVSAGDSDTLYFAASPDEGRDGLFGSLRVAETGQPASPGGQGRLALFRTAVAGGLFGPARAASPSESGPTGIRAVEGVQDAVKALPADRPVVTTEIADAASPAGSKAAHDWLFAWEAGLSAVL